MTKADRKNKTKLKIADSLAKTRESQNKYKENDGSCKTVVIESSLLEFLIKENELSVISEHESLVKAKFQKSNINFLFIKSENLSENELIYSLRYSDIAIFSCIPDLPIQCAITILCNETDEKSENYKKISKMQLKQNLINFVPKEKKRQAIIPDMFHFDDNGALVCSVFLDNGLISKHFVCDGSEELELKSIHFEGFSHDASTIFAENDEIQYDLKQLISVQKETPMDIIEDSEDEMSDISENDENEENISYKNKYRDYVGSNSISESESFPRCIPEYYSQLTIPRNTKIMEGRCIKQHKKCFEKKRVTLEFKPKLISNLKAPILVNLYNIEREKSVYNIYFSSKRAIKSNDDVLFDTGTRIFKARPLLSEHANFSIFKIYDNLYTGVMTFIGPITISPSKIIINNEEVGAFLEYSDRILAEEVVLEGSHFKVNQRHSVVRNMFNNREDVIHFKDFSLRSGKFNVGKIKEAMGTHGMFKAFFMKPVKFGEDVKMMLYKPTFPLNN